MKFLRHFTSPSLPVSQQIKWKICESKITKANGEIVFHMENIEVPEHWSQQATNILAQKYFRKAGVPSETQSDWGDTENVPTWLQRHIHTATAKFGSETSAKQVFHRLAGAWTYCGWKEEIFSLSKSRIQFTTNGLEEENARIFYDEIYFMLAHQHAAPNSPQWFNTGLFWAYGITGDANGQWICDETGPRETTNSYENPQPHACFIQPISDNLVEDGGIFDLLKKEALLFKHGSGTGTNFSNLRGKNELLGGGGKSSGLMSFLKIFDVAAGAIASGGTTRRAAKLITVDLDHPEIEDFVDLKMNEEAKAAALYVGSKIIQDLSLQIAASTHSHNSDDYSIDQARKYHIPEAMIDRARVGIIPEIIDLGFEGKAMNTIGGQNANNSPRITNKFLYAIDNDLDWELKARTTGKTIKTIKAKDLWNQIITAAWACADPGLLFHDIINEWHTCKNDGEIKSCNPCGEYQFLDNTACNLASLNLGKFLKDSEFQIKDFTHATRLWTIVLEISVFMASFPSREIAQNSYAYRTLGLGYMNLGGILMRLGLGYDSDEGRSWAANITALMHGIAYLTSQEMNNELGPFTKWENNEKSMSEVIQKHKDALLNIPMGFSVGRLVEENVRVWNKIDLTKGFRNAQVTLLAPTGTIHLITDCDTSGIEPDFSLIKYKNLSGGGMMEIVNECVPEALVNLGYTHAQIFSMTQHIHDYGNLEEYKINGAHLPEEHLCVFDCANPSGIGKRYLRPLSHILMMAAVQPFLSGAISKTCNLPNDASIQDVDDIYRSAHRLGLKAIAIYRDGSKLTQPLSSKKEKATILVGNFGSEPMCLNCIRNKDNSFTCLGTNNPICGQYNSKSLEEILENPSEPGQALKDLLLKPSIFEGKIQEIPTRQQLPNRRRGYTQKVRIDGQSVYLRTGEYDDGRLGEIWSEISREGSTVRALLSGFCKLTSVALQFGVPLEQLVKSFVYTKFEPAGIVQDHDKIKITTSIFDFIFRELAIHYLNQNEFANVIDKDDMTEIPIFLDLESSKSPRLFFEEEPESKPQSKPQEKEKPKSLNFTGNSCPNCGHNTLITTGTCTTCTTCYANTGCG